MTSVQFVRSPSRNESPMPTSSMHPTAVDSNCSTFVLPVDTMDVEVFERYIMKVLTSLHRLAGKISYDIDAAGVGKKTALTSTSDNSANATVLWTLVRRVTRRIEKLRAMEEVLEMKRKSLSALQQRHQGHGKRVPVNSQLQGDIFLVEALQAKLVASVSQFEELETNVMEKLCAI